MISSSFLRTLSRSGAAAALSVLGATAAFAQDLTLEAPAGSVGASGDAPTIKEMISFAATYLISISGGIAVLFLIYGGVIYMTAGGSDERVQSAKKVMRNAIVGLVIVLLAFVIVSNTLKISYSMKGTPAPVTVTVAVPTVTAVQGVPTSVAYTCSAACPTLSFVTSVTVVGATAPVQAFQSPAPAPGATSGTFTVLRTAPGAAIVTVKGGATDAVVSVN